MAYRSIEKGCMKRGVKGEVEGDREARLVSPRNEVIVLSIFRSF